jgi:hypothetical protein
VEGSGGRSDDPEVGHKNIQTKMKGLDKDGERDATSCDVIEPGRGRHGSLPRLKAEHNRRNQDGKARGSPLAVDNAAVMPPLDSQGILEGRRRLNISGEG